MSNTVPSIDALLRNVRKTRLAQNRWEGQIRIGDVLLSVDGNGVYDVGTAARSHIRGARRDVVPVLESLLQAQGAA